MTSHDRVSEALRILTQIGMPRGQLNERSALCLLALADITPDKAWHMASAPLIGVTPMIAFCATNYGKEYAPNTRETIRRQSIHQFMQAGLVQKNPDDLGRPINSPATVYQLTQEALVLLRAFGQPEWERTLAEFLTFTPSLAQKYAQQRDRQMIPVVLGCSQISLSPGNHSLLIKKIIEGFFPRFAPASRIIYLGDTGQKLGYFDQEFALRLDLHTDDHGKFPDVIAFDERRNWLFLIEAVTSHGPVDPKRHIELTDLFRAASCPLVFVTAFLDRSAMARFVPAIAWETEVWVADNASHLVHFDGDRLLGPRGE